MHGELLIVLLSASGTTGTIVAAICGVIKAKIRNDFKKYALDRTPDQLVPQTVDALERPKLSVRLGRIGPIDFEPEPMPAIGGDKHRERRDRAVPAADELPALGKPLPGEGLGLTAGEWPDLTANMPAGDFDSLAPGLRGRQAKARQHGS
jgi:hypothetical protein